MAELAAMAPSEEAVTSWRKFLERQSPAAKSPARLVEQVSSVIMKPDWSKRRRLLRLLLLKISVREERRPISTKRLETGRTC